MAAQGIDGGGAEFTLPTSLARSILPDTVPDMAGMPDGSFQRAGVETYLGSPGGLGSTIFPGFTPEVYDRRRPRVSPAGLVDWWPVKNREFNFPTVQETSRVTGSRWGGITSKWGLGETVLPAAADASVANIAFVQNRLLIYTTVTRDIWEDSDRLERWLNVIALGEIRFAIDSAIVNGILGGPIGIITSPCTVTVSKGATGSSSISSINIDAMWSAMYAGSRENCVWMCNDDTLQKIDQLGSSASRSQWAETPYIGYVPAGRYGQPFPTLKGRPIIACEACPVIGNPGDLICWDPTDYIFTYLRAATGGISIAVDVPPAKHATAMIGMPEGSVQRLISDQVLFTTDELAILWKFRGDGKFLWNTTMTNLNGATVGPAAIIAQR